MVQCPPQAAVNEACTENAIATHGTIEQARPHTTHCSGSEHATLPAAAPHPSSCGGRGTGCTCRRAAATGEPRQTRQPQPQLGRLRAAEVNSGVHWAGDNSLSKDLALGWGIELGLRLGLRWHSGAELAPSGWGAELASQQLGKKTDELLWLESH